MFLPKEKIKPPKSLRSARLSVVKNQISTPVIQSTAIAPKKVIKALYDYKAQQPFELSFSRGDFFLVSPGTETDPDYYEAFNPITNSRGKVPVSYFQALEKHEKAMVDSAKVQTTLSSPSQPVETHQKPHPLYAVVRYDFVAERSDELTAREGEPIIIIAQSNPEWYVAKPIERLGGPGLIPVSFVDVRDAATGQTMENGQPFPDVREWKKQIKGYEDTNPDLAEQQLQQLRLQEPDRRRELSIQEEEDEMDPVADYYHSVQPKTEDDTLRVLSAYIDSFILEGDQYWFIVFARLSNGKFRVLYRLYEDFYDFQMSFLQAYPMEAGKYDQERMIPFMPGPSDIVDDTITADRARELSEYCDKLLKLPDYLSTSTWVQEQLFGIHEGDIETEMDPALGYLPNDPVDAYSQGALPAPHSPQPHDTHLPNQINTAITNTNYHTNTNYDHSGYYVPKTPSTPATPATPSVYPGQVIKVKIKYRDEIYAIKVPIPVTVDMLRNKVIDRIGFEVELFYKNGDPLLDLNTEVFESAVKIGKLTVLAS
ncbi:Protein scd2/ral3 [Choanephora cucurbitarum]|uniref:Protein scd2/ral3 n=1 Tax=Choanephora cucurbitarum TaxID=101091 RepID=A0A1C7N6V7_9FUNG|nr:Protein scd2/ral3 [Choanephora cucurbitarum]